MINDQFPVLCFGKTESGCVEYADFPCCGCLPVVLAVLHSGCVTSAVRAQGQASPAKLGALCGSVATGQSESYVGERSGWTGGLVQAGHPGLSGGQHGPAEQLHLRLEGWPRLLCSHPQVQAGPHRLRGPEARPDSEVT